MHFVCLKEYIEKAVAYAERVVGRGSLLPVLQNFLFIAQEGKIKLLATNLEFGLELSLPGKIHQEGRVAIPARVLGGLVHRLPDEKIEIKEKNKTVFIQTKSFKASLQKLATEEFPLLPPVPTISPTPINGKVFVLGITKTLPMVSFSDTRPELTGIFIQIQKETVSFAATDTFRLGEFTYQKQQNTGQDHAFILPVKAAQEFIRVFSEDPTLAMYVTNQQVFFQTEDKVFISRLIEGEYPPYQNIIPSKGNTKITVSKKKLIQNLETTGLFSGKLQDTRVYFRPQTGSITLTAKNEGFGESETTLSVIGEGEENNLVFNWRYLLDGLGQIEDDEITWWINKETEPSIIFPTKQTPDGSFRYVLMPIRLS